MGEEATYSELLKGVINFVDSYCLIFPFPLLLTCYLAQLSYYYLFYGLLHECAFPFGLQIPLRGGLVVINPLCLF